MMVGLNAYSLYKGFDNVQSVTLAKADGEHEFACVQGQKTLMGRETSSKKPLRNFLIPKMLMFG
jgi:hypothetical protein